MVILGPGEEKTIKHNILYCTAVFSYCSTIQYSTIHIFPKFLCSTALLTGPLSYLLYTAQFLFCTTFLLCLSLFCYYFKILLFYAIALLVLLLSISMKKQESPSLHICFFLLIPCMPCAMCMVYCSKVYTVLYNVHMLKNAF